MLVGMSYTYCVCTLPCVNSWSVSGVIMPGAFVDDRCLQASLALLDSPADHRF